MDVMFNYMIVKDLKEFSKWLVKWDLFSWHITQKDSSHGIQRKVFPEEQLVTNRESRSPVYSGNMFDLC